MNGFHTRWRGFTLIELLVVVSLTSLLLALGMPAFSRMARGNKVEECARSIKLGLEQAQLRAASERRYVAVIFPNGDENVTDGLRRYRLGGFRCAYVTKNSSGKYEFKRWLDSGWRNEPAGAMLVKVGTKSSKFDRDADGFVTDCTKKTTDALEGVTVTTSTDAGETTDEVFKSLVSLKDDSGGELKAGDHYALIFNPYGGVVSGAKLYLLVSETGVNGDAIEYPSSGGAGLHRTANYLVLKVNNLTGRVEYYSDEE
ncbi:MAG: prepilin-type N-terminal cleavage/methylation domain-containing protein [Lentisphaeria bacterium]|nr:prepilin-type N-terminal cleavage/methylation domain-containing protein [Lentisphaeria bacterium]